VGRLRGRPDPGLGTRIASNSGPSWVLSCRWPAVTSIARVGQAIGGQVDLGGQPAAAAPEGLVTVGIAA
jgi:hypothetical protein